MMMSIFVPRLEMLLRTLAVADCPSVTMAITEATPITIPSVVRAERRTFRRRARKAMSKVASHMSRLRWRIGLVTGYEPVFELDNPPSPAGNV